MNRIARSSANPAVDAAALLRRFGFALLVVAAPLLAVGSRRGLVIVVPLGVALMVLATVVETEGREPLLRFWRALRSTTGGIAAFLAFWAALSLVWTPFPSEASERVLNLVGIALVGLLSVTALPERMRASNLYLVPIGVGLAGLAVVVIVARILLGRSPAADIDQAQLERGVLMVVLLTPAAVTWLLSKDRLVSGFMLVAVVTASLVLAEAHAALVALVAGAIIYGVATVNGRAGRLLALVAIPGLVLLAPLVPFVLRPLSKLALGAMHGTIDTIRIWCRMITDDLLRLVTGHGLDTALRAKLAGLVPPAAPTGLLFELWFELGLLGAIALSLLLARAINGTARLHAGVAPGALMTLVVAFVLAVAGKGAAQSWWLTGLAVATMAILAVERGQYRTTRPKTSTAPSAERPAPSRPAASRQAPAERPVPLRPPQARPPAPRPKL
jgi:hypothetical protein